MSLSSCQHSSHPELFPVLTSLIVTGQVGSQKGGQTCQVMANPPVTFPQEFRLIERDQDDFPTKFGSLVRHKALREAEDGEVVVVQHPGRSSRHMILHYECLNVSREMVHNHQHVFYYGFLVSGYSDLHAHIVYVDQFHRLSADDRLHRWELALGLVLNTSPAVCYGFQENLGHARPPEAFLHQAQCAVLALVSGTTVASIDSSLSVIGWDHKNWRRVLAIRGSSLEV